MIHIGIIIGILLVHIANKLSKKKCEHKWKLVKEKEQGFIHTTNGQEVGNVYPVSFKAYKCNKCRKFKFWYSKNMRKWASWTKLKELFEFEVINGLEK